MGEWHLDRFSRFCTANPCDQHTQTDRQTQTTLRAASEATGRICALRACDAAK